MVGFNKSQTDEVVVMESNMPPVKVLGQNAHPIITSVHASESALHVRA